jgi:hypothetical protein
LRPLTKISHYAHTSITNPEKILKSKHFWWQVFWIRKIEPVITLAHLNTTLEKRKDNTQNGRKYNTYV